MVRLSQLPGYRHLRLRTRRPSFPNLVELIIPEAVVLGSIFVLYLLTAKASWLVYMIRSNEVLMINLYVCFVEISELTYPVAQPTYQLASPLSTPGQSQLLMSSHRTQGNHHASRVRMCTNIHYPCQWSWSSCSDTRLSWWRSWMPRCNKKLKDFNKTNPGKEEVWVPTCNNSVRGCNSRNNVLHDALC